MPVIRKVQSKVFLPTRPVVSADPLHPVLQRGERGAGKQLSKSIKDGISKEESRVGETAGSQKEAFRGKEGRVRRVCYFCKSKTQPVYWEATTLRRYVNDRGRIAPRTKTGACAKHQRRLQQEIKRARLLALLPFAPRI